MKGKEERQKGEKGEIGRERDKKTQNERGKENRRRAMK